MANISNAKNKLGNALKSSIQNNDNRLFQDTIKRICKTVSLTDFSIDEELTSSWPTHDMKFGENIELTFAGKLYFTNWIQQNPNAKTITPTCSKSGLGISVNTLNCGQCAECQVPQECNQLITVNNHQLCATFRKQTYRNLSCGEDIFNAFRSSYDNLIINSRNDVLFDCILNELNNPLNYKNSEGVTVNYDCSSCNGTGIISAILSLSKKMIYNPEQYNKKNRIYRLPMKEQIIIISHKIADQISGILANTYNAELQSLSNKFYKVIEAPITADFIIADRRWLQLAQGINEINIEEDFKNRSQCIFVDYDFKWNVIDCVAAVFAKLNEITPEQAKEVTEIVKKVQSMINEFRGETQEIVCPLIDTEVQKFKTSESKLKLETSCSDFVKPTENQKGSIKVLVTIKDEQDNILDTIGNQFAVNKASNNKQENE